MSKPFLISAASIKLTPLDFEGNVESIIRVINDEKEKGTDLVCFPELCVSGYGCEDAFLFPDVISAAEYGLKKIVAASKQIAVSVGVPLYFKGALYNCAALIHNQIILAIIPKQHLANDGIHYEPRWFIPGVPGKKDFIELFGEKIPFGDLVVDLEDQKIGFEICEDAWVTDRPANFFKERGVTIIINPSASHFALRKYSTRLALMRQGSKESQSVYIFANQLGNEAGRAIYDGDALILVRGTVVAATTRFSFQDYSVCRYEISSEKKETAVTDIVTYSGSKSEQFEEFTKAAALGLYDYFKKSGVKQFVLSLSGGADSASVLLLVRFMVSFLVAERGFEDAKKILGARFLKVKYEKEIMSLLITCVYQGTAQNSEITRSAAKKIASECGASFYDFSIDDEVSLYQSKIEKILNRKLDWSSDDIALQNIQSRVRSPGIWFLTNSLQGLLLTTGNRSEAAVGYATMDGDTSGSLAPIAGVSKFFIREWLLWVQNVGFLPLGAQKYLECITSQAPTAELRPLSQNQTDEADLMPYEVLCFFEEGILRNKTPVKEVLQSAREKFLDTYSETTLSDWLNRFLSLWSLSQWKRERLAPGFHLDDFSVDSRTWLRYPILSKKLSV